MVCYHDLIDEQAEVGFPKGWVRALEGCPERGSESIDHLLSDGGRLGSFHCFQQPSTFGCRLTQELGSIESFVLALFKRGVAPKEIMRRTGKSRGLVRRVVRGGRADIFRTRMSSLDPFLTQLETAWADGNQNGAALRRAVKTKGFTGGLRVVTEWAMRKRKDEGTATRDKRPGKTPSARHIARMMTAERDTRSKVVARTMAIIGAAVPDLTTAQDLLDRFHRLIQHRNDKRLDEWLADAKPGLMASFASADVWASQSRPAAGPSYRDGVIVVNLSPNIASEPHLPADSHAGYSVGRGQRQPR